MGQGYEHIGVHDSPADLCGLYVFAAFHRDLHLVIALQTIANENVAAGGVGRKAVDISRFNVIQGVLAAADIQRVAVGQERLAALTLDQVHHDLGPVGTQISQVAGLTEVHLDGHIFAIHLDVAKAGSHHKTGQLLGQVFPPGGAAEVRKIDFRFFSHV